MLEQPVSAWTAGTSAATVVRNVRAGLRAQPTSVRIDGGVITDVGSVESDAGVEIDAGGRTMLPGMWDAHVHMTQWASTRRRIDVSAAASARQVAELVASAVEGPGDPQDLLFGYGFRDGLWQEPPHKDVLEAAIPGRAVIVLSNDLHAVWLSPAALARIGRGGHPTGVFREADAREAQAALPRATDEELDRWVAEAVEASTARGITGLMDFEVSDNVRDWARRLESRRLDVQVTCAIYPQYLDDVIRMGLRTGDTVPGTRGGVTVGPVKIILDGSLNTRTALCRDPYPGRESATDSHGLQLTGTDDLEEIMKRASANGLIPAVHAIGDEANTIALDAFERVGCGGRIEHAQLLRDDDVRRLGRLGIVAGIQPAHVPGDRDVADRVWRGRTGSSFRYADLLEAGVPLEIGSDAPVTPLDPWHGIAAAVSRDDDVRGPWHPEQVIGIDDAVAAACRGRTSIAPGDPADLVIVDDDPAGVDRTRLRTLPVAGTLLGGRWTYRSAALSETRQISR